MVMSIIRYFMEAKEIQFYLKMTPLSLAFYQVCSIKFIERLLVTYEKHFHAVCLMGITFKHRVQKCTILCKLSVKVKVKHIGDGKGG